MVRSRRISIFLLLAALWTAGLFATPHPLKAQAQPAIPQEHIVQPGEDMQGIAALYQITAPALAWANDLSLPVELVPGQRLRLPPSAQPPGSAPSVAGPQAAPPAAPQIYPASQQELTGEKWIDIDLSDQVLTALQGDTPVASFWISSGVADHPTVTGSFRIWAKVSVQDMSGGSRAAGTYYYAEDVPWVQYFYADYSIHGAYWHDAFGQPASHGCINMRIEEARWLFEWAEPSMDQAMVENGTWFFPQGGGTRVEVHE